MNTPVHVLYTRATISSNQQHWNGICNARFDKHNEEAGLFLACLHCLKPFHFIIQHS